MGECSAAAWIVQRTQGYLPPKLWSISKLFQNILALGQDVLSLEKRANSLSTSWPWVRVNWDGWYERNIQMNPRSLRNAAVWRDGFYSCGAYVNIIMVLKSFPWQLWTSTSGSTLGMWKLICDQFWLPPQHSTDDSGMVNETRSQPPFSFCMLTTANITFFFFYLSHCWFPLPSTACHLTLLFLSFTLLNSASFLSLSLPDTSVVLTFILTMLGSIGSAYICTH